MRLLNRRWFLYAATPLAAASTGIWAAARGPEPDLISSTCAGADQMPRKILIAYATRAGSTAKVADAIARRLCDAGLRAEVRPVAEVEPLDDYDGAVLGSAIRFAAWLPGMIGCLDANRRRLAEMPVAVFTMHMLALGDDPAAMAERAKYTAKARDLVTPVEEVFFEGMIDLARLSFLDRLAVRLVKSPIGDRRNWQRIETWATGLATRLVT